MSLGPVASRTLEIDCLRYTNFNELRREVFGLFFFPFPRRSSHTSRILPIDNPLLLPGNPRRIEII